MPKFFSPTVKLSGAVVVIAGGGELALRKARLVTGDGVKLNIIAHVISAALKAELAGRAAFIERGASAADFAGAKLVFIAVEDAEEAARLGAIARENGALVNVVDQPDISDFFTPSIIERGDITVSISTGGAAPVLGRRLREKIDALLPARLGSLARFADDYRSEIAERIAPDRRRAFWERFFDGPIAHRVVAGDAAGAHAEMRSRIDAEAADASDEDAQGEGVVHIVGAGPGDAELLTLRAHRLIQSADVILYDRLVGGGILELARRDAVRLYVGKAKADHAVPQEEIGRRLIAFAREGKIVVRLKGGDPFVFGRGGEELDALRAAGVKAFVTPGVTAATGCAASAGMALTHRDHAQAVTFVTGHAKGDSAPDIDWTALAALKNTLVVYMGVGRAAEIAADLIGGGRAPSTPVTVIENGTRDNEVVVKGALGDLGGLVRRARIKGPALLVIGEVAAFAAARDLRATNQHERLSA